MSPSGPERGTLWNRSCPNCWPVVGTFRFASDSRCFSTATTRPASTSWPIRKNAWEKAGAGRKWPLSNNFHGETVFITLQQHFHQRSKVIGYVPFDFFYRTWLQCEFHPSRDSSSFIYCIKNNESSNNDLGIFLWTETSPTWIEECRPSEQQVTGVPDGASEAWSVSQSWGAEGRLPDPHSRRIRPFVGR